MVIITCLNLYNGQTIVLGEPWPGAKPEEAIPVSLIIERSTETSQDDEDSPLVETPAHYECWLFNDELRIALFTFFSAVKRARVTGQTEIPVEVKSLLEQAINQAPSEILKRKIWGHAVASAEEQWVKDEALFEVQAYFQSELGLDDSGDGDGDEDAPAPARPNGPVVASP